jgi:hypothetical protein
MNRLLLRALNPLMVVLLAWIIMILQTSLFTLPILKPLQPDALILGMVWFALRRKFVEGGVLTLILAYLAEMQSSAPQGSFMILYMGTYLMVRGLNRLLVVSDLTKIVFMTLGATLFWRLGMILLFRQLGLVHRYWEALLWWSLPTAAFTGLLGLLIYPWFQKLDDSTFKSTRSQKLLEDDLKLDEGV